jgi:hypothetical protein
MKIKIDIDWKHYSIFLGAFSIIPMAFFGLFVLLILVASFILWDSEFLLILEFLINEPEFWFFIIRASILMAAASLVFLPQCKN